MEEEEEEEDKLLLLHSNSPGCSSLSQEGEQEEGAILGEPLSGSFAKMCIAIVLLCSCFFVDGVWMMWARADTLRAERPPYLNCERPEDGVT